MWFPNRSDTNQDAQPQKQDSTCSLKFWIYEEGKCTIRVLKTKVLISFAVTTKLICAFVFAYANCWFSHEVAQM